MASRKPWYEGRHQDLLLYLLVAIFFLELIVGGVAFFYGIMHARPEVAGGPPLAQFPWLGWALAAFLAPVGLLVIVHLAGTWFNRSLEGEQTGSDEPRDLPPALQKLYSAIRHAPTILILLGILLAGAALFFIDGAMAALVRLGEQLMPHLPWLVGSVAGLLAICFVTRALLVYRQRKLDHEYAWRREVLEKTGVIIADKRSAALPMDQPALPGRADILDVSALPPADSEPDPHAEPDSDAAIEPDKDSDEARKPG